MRILLDTQCWLWMRSAPERLSRRSRDLLAAPDNELLLSAASSWEIALKWALGKLELPSAPGEYVRAAMVQDGVGGLPVQHAHALRVAELPRHHGDPFDRLLIAQAQLESLRFLTADRHLARYDVEIIRA